MESGKVLEGFELKSVPFVPDGVSSSVSFIGTDSRIPLTEEVMSKHILYTGSIGTGKTNAIFQLLKQLIPSMSRDDVMVVFDTKGDFKKEFFRPGKDVIISNDASATEYWNIFKEALIDGVGSMEGNLLEIVNSFFEDKIKKSNAPFFPQAAKDVLFGIMSYIIYKNDPEDLDNYELYAYLQDADIDEVIDALSSYGDLRGIIDYIYSGGAGSEQTQGVYSELRNVSYELLVGNFRKRGKFSAREFIRNKGGRILFIEYDLGIGKVLTPIYKAMFDLAIKEALCRQKSEGNVYFVIDEFRLLPNLYHIDNGVNFGRSLGAKFIVAMQNIRQVIEGYGKESAYSILSAFGTTVAFRTTDRATKEFIQSIYGKHRSGSYSSGKKEELLLSDVVEDWMVLGLKTGESILSVSDYDYAPVRFRFKKYV